MTWKPSQTAEDEITHDEWNEFAQCLLNVSGNAISFSSNAKSLFAGSSNLNRTILNATSGSLHKLWTWSSNKTWYANSSNVKSRFPGSSTAISRYRQSSARWNYVSSASISGQWRTPLYLSLTAAGAASTKPFKIICTSGNANGTWVWISVYNGSSYQWNQITYSKP